ncbi:hypothetical protein ASG94_09600 [Nocardioides sp. Soil805]|nr:hypothetical protein ASG94_09600 [Nocardioides sp. Soil805]
MRTGRVRAAAVAAALGLALTTGCSGGDAADEADEPAPAPSATDRPSQPSAGGGDGSTAAPVADPEHSVDPPGRRTGTLVGPDLRIYSQQPLSDALVERIEGNRRVQRVERISLGDFGVQNGVITVAAVDPATYRNYTPYVSAELQEVWDRVAGGELAIDKALGRRLQDADGYLKLGNDKDAERVHIGAYAPQVPQVDAVVNEKWGEELGIESGNALLVYTGIHSPRDVRKDLVDLVGDEASVTILGPNLDPGATQTAVLTGGSVADAVGTFRYTVLGGGRIAPDQSWVGANIRTEPVPILGSMTCHRVVFPQLRAALLEVQQRGLADEIHVDEYAGCFYPRFIAGTQQLSLHSFGIAFDVNVPGNQRGTVGEIDRDVVDIFKKWGFAWGGDWGYTDPMHFEMNAIVDPD